MIRIFFFFLPLWQCKTTLFGVSHDWHPVNNRPGVSQPREGSEVHETPEVTIPHFKYMHILMGEDSIVPPYSQIRTSDRFRTTELGHQNHISFKKSHVSILCIYIFYHPLNSQPWDLEENKYFTPLVQYFNKDFMKYIFPLSNFNENQKNAHSFQENSENT